MWIFFGPVSTSVSSSAGSGRYRSCSSCIDSFLDLLWFAHVRRFPRFHGKEFIVFSLVMSVGVFTLLIETHVLDNIVMYIV